MTIALRIDPEDLTVDPGRDAVFTVHVVNRSGVVDRVALDLLGTAASWGRIEPSAVALMPGTDATATLFLTPPMGTALGPVAIGIRATAETSGFVEVGEANLNVGASRTVDAELRPRTVTGKRRATSVIVLHNRGNAAAKVQMVATDPDDAIVFEPPRAVQVGPGMTAEVPLRMRLPARDKQGANLPYQVLVEGGETAQSLDGQVRQPAKKKWPIMAAMMALALIVVAIVLLRPKDSVAIAGSPVATTTTAVAGATTLPGTPAAGPNPEVTTATPSPATPGGPAPTAAPVTSAGGGTVSPTVTSGGGTGVLVPTTVPRTTVPPLPCPAKGTTEQTAQRVVCAWELGRLSEVGESTTPEAVKALLALTPNSGQKVTTVGVPGRSGVQVNFGSCVAGKGVTSVFISTTGSTAGRVFTPITACPTSTFTTSGLSSPTAIG